MQDWADYAEAERRIVGELRQHGVASAAELTRLTGLSKATVSASLKHLRQDGLVEDVEFGAVTGRGRPPKHVRLTATAGACGSVVLAPDSLVLTLADLGHRILGEKEVPIDEGYSLAEAAEITRGELLHMIGQAEMTPDMLIGLGIAAPGPVLPENGTILRSSIKPQWANENLKQTFVHALDCPVFADNESNCSALAEMTWGVAKGVRNFIYYKLDYGVGAGIVIDGKLVSGIAGGAGEVGHISINRNGDICRCGNRGCLELFAGWANISRQASHLLGGSFDIDEAAALLPTVPTLQRIVLDGADAAGFGLSLIAATLNPELVVLGGRQQAFGQPYRDALVHAFEDSTLIKPQLVDKQFRTRVVEAALPDLKGIALGAVSLPIRGVGRVL